MTGDRHPNEMGEMVVEPVAGPVDIDEIGDPLLAEGMPAAVVIDHDLPVSDSEPSWLAARPAPGTPREYRFPSFERTLITDGLTLITAHLPGRPLLYGQLIVRGGAAVEPAHLAGVSVLMARAMTEGTAHRDGVELTEAAERLGAEVEAESGWESLVAGISVPRSRFSSALALLAEVVFEPSFPEREVDRMREERLNDLMQAKADPRRRAERVFPETIYTARTPFARPLGGTDETVPAIDRAAVVATHAGLTAGAPATFVVAGDLSGIDVERLVTDRLGAWRGSGAARPPVDAPPNEAGPRIVVVDRPGSPQSEVRIGHLGVARSTADFHAISVLNTILGGQFGSRLNRLLREERGYTYGVHSGFDMRRSVGPFAVRMAVQTEVTVPAIIDAVGELRRIREAPVDDDELTHARDYLVGVFPLRFEAAPQVAAAINGLIVHDLPDDELDAYRPAIAAVTADQVLAAALAHVRPDDASIVVVGDAKGFVDDLRAAGIGDVSVVEDAPAG